MKQKRAQDFRPRPVLTAARALRRDGPAAFHARDAVPVVREAVARITGN